MNRFLMLLIVLSLSTPCYAERVFTEVRGSRDSDEASSLFFFAGYRQPLTDSGDTEFEIAAGQRSYSEPGERERFDAGRLQLQSSLGRGSHMQLRCEFLAGDDWSPTLPAASFSSRLNDNWYLELSAEREPVDSVSAIRSHTRVDSYVASADYRIDERWTVVGAYIDQRFSDDNRKRGGVGRVIFSPEKYPEFNIQLKGRLLQADQDSPDYFSPRMLNEAFLLLGYGTPFADDNWVIKLLAGPGVQHIEPFEEASRTKTGYHGELSLHGWFDDHVQLISRLGCTSATGTQDAYSYCFGNMHLGYAW